MARLARALAPALAALLLGAAPGARSAEGGWTRVEPGGATGCADGSAYAYFVREGDPKRLLLFLQGGGACWSARGCDPEGEPTYDVAVGPEDDPSANAEGLLALEDARNPFRGWSALFVPYCTGDVHLGGAPRRYPLVAGPEAAPRFVEIHHRGRANAEAALAGALARLEPERVFVAGESAGAVASPYWAAVVAERLPQARVAQLGDAAGGYRARAVADLLETWGAAPAVREHLDLPPGSEAPDFESLYVGAGRRHPELALARLDRAEDLVQRFFLTQVGVAGPTLHSLLVANLEEIRTEVPRVRQYLAPGPVHTTLTSPAFYTLQVEGRALRDWVAEHAEGKPVSDVLCQGCAPEP